MQVNPVKNTINHDFVAQQTQKVQRAQEAKVIPQEKPVEEAGKPEFHQEPDQYTPREPEAASGRYWMEQGEEGSKVRFDAPEDKDEIGRASCRERV